MEGTRLANISTENQGKNTWHISALSEKAAAAE